MTFIDFRNEVVKRAKEGSFSLIINGVTKRIKALAEYKTIHDLNYFKIVFEDKSFLYIVPSDREIYYSETYVVETGIDDVDVGNSDVVEYNGKEYFLDNQNDYQFVKRILVGNIGEIEGEVSFSDYVPKEGDDFLSLGWATFNKKRADINPELISLEKISFID